MARPAGAAQRGWRMPWPEGGDALDYLGLSIGTPFPWRQQLPLFFFDAVLYTFVLAGDHEGEIWRYEISPDAWDSVRAATSLATLFDQWTRGIAAGVVVYDEQSKWLLVVTWAPLPVSTRWPSR